MSELAGKTAIVTGASAPRGIGRAIAEELARQGAAVVVTDIDGPIDIAGTTHRRRDLLEEVVAAIRNAGGQALALVLDVTRETDIAACVAATSREFGGIDILINNAGSLAGSAAFMATTPAQWTDSFRVNLLGPMMCSQAVLPQMQARGGGAIINIGSTGSLGAEAGFGAYTAMKHGLIGLTKTIAAEFGSSGIRCNAVCPGFIMTDMHAAANARLAAEGGISAGEVEARRYAGVALGAAGSPQDVADTVAYLAGPRAAYMTGAALPVSGGVSPGI